MEPGKGHAYLAGGGKPARPVRADLALRRHADLLEELAYTHIEGIFVHVVLQLLTGRKYRRGIRRALAFAVADQREMPERLHRPALDEVNAAGPVMRSAQPAPREL